MWLLGISYLLCAAIVVLIAVALIVEMTHEPGEASPSYDNRCWIVQVQYPCDRPPYKLEE